MWQKPAQPSASIYRRPTAGPASALSIAICYSRSFCLPASSPPPSTLGHHRASFFPSRPVARSPPPPPLPFFDHRRCCQTTTCTPGPGQLPSCGHPFPSIFLSRSHSALGLSRPLRRVILPPSRSLYLRAVIYPLLASPLLLFSRHPAAHPPAPHRLSVMFFYNGSHNVVLLLFAGLYPTPFLPPMMQRALSISATLIDDNDFLAVVTSAISCRPATPRSSNLWMKIDNATRV